MEFRKKKLRIIQLSLLLFGSLVIFFTYTNKNEITNQRILTKESQEKVQDQISNQNEKEDVFYNIEYSGLDLSGNRYILRSKEAYNDRSNQELVNMRLVEAFFYFKNGSVLKISSEKGIYNNKTLDMVFNNNIKALYENSKLYAQKAEYSNSGGYLIVSEEVEVNDIKGKIKADKLFFDIKKQTLEIASFDDNKINANINFK